MRFPLRAILVTALLVLPAAPAHAAGWLPAVQIAGGTSLPKTDTVAGNAAGQVISWEDRSSGDSGVLCTQVEVSSRAVGGAWTTPDKVKCGTSVSLSQTGEVIAVWTDTDADTGDGLLEIASAPAGSNLGSPTVLDRGSATVGNVTLRFDPHGVPTVAFTGDTANGPGIFTVTRNADGSWPATPVTAYAPGPPTNPAQPYSTAQWVETDPGPDFAIGPSGEMLLVWFNEQCCDPLGVRSAYRPVPTSTTPNPAWQPYVSLSYPSTGPATSGYSQIKLNIDPQGRASAIAMMGNSSLGPWELDGWTRAAGGGGGGWSSPQVVSNSTGSSYQPVFDTAFDSSGNEQLAFVWVDGTDDHARVARRAAGNSSWTADPELYSAPAGDAVTAPGVAVDPADATTVSFAIGGTVRNFTRAAGSSSYVEQALPPGATGASSVNLASDADGYLTATWTAPDGSAMFSSVYDPIAPTIDSAAPPPAPVAGQATTFTIGGSDAWGPVTYSIDFGDGQPAASGRALPGWHPPLARATVATTVSHTYASAGSYTANLTVTDAAANSATTTIPVTVAAAPTASPTPTPPAPSTLPPPVLGKFINVFVLKEPVFIKLPGQKRFHRLTVKQAQLPNGTVIDTRRGRVLVVIDNGHGGQDSAQFYDGVFEVNQPKKLKGLANIFLNGGGFKGCPKAPKDPHAQLSRKSRSKHRSVRHLWANGHGKFRTVGRFSSAAIRGTKWLTDDRCDGTLTRVVAGKVAVRDFVKRKTVTVKARHKYFARARKR